MSKRKMLRNYAYPSKANPRGQRNLLPRKPYLPLEQTMKRLVHFSFASSGTGYMPAKEIIKSFVF